MANFVVCVDLEHAKIFELHASSVEETSLKRREVRHHTAEDKAQNNHKHADKFFDEVAGHLTEAHEILVIGPGLAKKHFKERMEHSHHENVGKKIVGVETVDHPTDGQVIALAKKFFVGHKSAEN